MYLLIIILHKDEWLEDVLSCLIEIGIEDAIILEGESLEKVLAKKVPLFAGIKFNLKGKDYSKIILAISDFKGVGREITEILKPIGLNFEEEGTGRILTLKLDSIIGIPKEIIEV